jgi:hypothetical protein
MAKFSAGDIICHKENNIKWIISKVSNGNYYLKGLDRRVYITVTDKDLPYFYVFLRGKNTAKAIYE